MPNPGAGDIPGALIYAGTGRGPPGNPHPRRFLVRRLRPPHRRCLQPERQDRHPRQLRAFVLRRYHDDRVHPPEGLHPDRGLRQHLQRHLADVPLQGGPAALPRAALHQPLLPERRRYALVAGSGSHPPARAEQHQPLHPAAALDVHGARRRLQRRRSAATCRLACSTTTRCRSPPWRSTAPRC